MTEELYEAYETSRDLVQSDPVLSEQERADRLTTLTDELIQAETESGISWTPVFEMGVAATGDGSATFDVPRHEKE